eukprot:3467574-Lingulodinium_polyedra.AAC.1
MARARPKGKAKAKAKGASGSSQASLRSHRGTGISPDEKWLKSQINRVLAQKFKGWTEEEIDHFMVEELSLRQTLERDKSQWCLHGVPALSGDYYKKIKASFRPGSSIEDHLSWDEADPANDKAVDSKLAAAWASCHPPRPRRSVLTELLAENNDMTEKEFIGTLKHVLMVKKNNCGDEGLQLVLAAAEYIVTKKYTERFKKHVDLMLEWFDELFVVVRISVYSRNMCIHAGVYSRNMCIHAFACVPLQAQAMRTWASPDDTTKTILEHFKASLALSLGDVEKAIQLASLDDAQLDEHMEALNSLVLCSQCGQYLFGSKLVTAGEAKVKTSLDKHITELIGAKVTLERVAETKKMFVQEVLEYFTEPQLRRQ